MSGAVAGNLGTHCVPPYEVAPVAYYDTYIKAVCLFCMTIFSLIKADFYAKVQHCQQISAISLP